MPQREKIRYEVDHLNRLWMQELDRDGLPLGPRIALEGSFRTKKNALLYRLRTAPKLESRRRLPHEIFLTGQWSLTPNHDLALTLGESSSQREGDVLILKGNLLYAESNVLGFAVTTRKKGERQARILRLEGKWEADPENRLTFHVEKERGDDDVLRFEAAWEVGKQNELIYRYTKRLLPKGERREETLSLRGFWEISDENRLTYRFDADGESVFHFRATLESRSLLAKEGAVRYQVGIELTGRKRPKPQTITLFGKWKLNHDLSIDFELTHQKGNPQRLHFGATYRLPNNHEVSFSLEDERGRPFGIEVRFKKEEVGAEFFLRLKRGQKEDLIEAGGRIPF